VNSTRAVIADASIEVEYDTDMLHLDRIEPATLVRRDDRVVLGSLMPGERKTVSLLFDPQICQGTHIDGLLTYVDSAGVRHRVDMKRRSAEVVCPIFFTREHANTAMLRRLITEGLRATDLRVLRYPPKLGPGVILGLAKAALGERVIQLVREYVKEGPPFYAEVWYYGETKVKGYQIVMRLGVVEEKGVLELFAASTAMEPIAGLLAEFRRDLIEVLSREAPGKGAVELEKDEDVHRWLAERQLLLDHIFDDEGPATGKDGGPKGDGTGAGGVAGAGDAETKK